MKKAGQNLKNVRPKRNAACRVQTYSLLQSGYNEQRDLKRALKCSLIEAKAAQIKQKNLDAKKKSDQSTNKKANGLIKNDKLNKPSGNLNVKTELKKPDNKQANKQDNKKSSNDKAKSDEIVVKRFTAHRKFAQNCQPFPNNSIPIDFKEKGLTTNEKLSTFKQPAQPVVPNELFENVTTHEFLTFLCFRDYVSLPFSLDKEMNIENDDSSKFETRKENSTDLVSATNDKESKNDLFKENSKKVKLNGNKLKQEITEKEEDKLNQAKINQSKVNAKSSPKLNGSSKLVQNKLNNAKLNQSKLNSPSKLNQIKNQLKNSPSKINQIKSNKLTKLAKLNKVKLEEKKKINEQNDQSNVKSNLKLNKNKVDNQIKGSELANKTVDDKLLDAESIKNIIKKSIKKKCQTKPIAKNQLTKSDKSSRSKIKKELPKIKKEETKVKKQVMNTRQLRNGRFHHYQTKF